MTATPHQVNDYVIAMQDEDMADLLGGYVAADPMAMNTLRSMLRTSLTSLGKEANREAMVMAATRFCESIRSAAAAAYPETIRDRAEWQEREAADRRSQLSAFAAPGYASKINADFIEG